MVSKSLHHPGRIDDGIGPRAFRRQLRDRNRRQDRVPQVLRAGVSLLFFFRDVWVPPATEADRSDMVETEKE